MGCLGKLLADDVCNGVLSVPAGTVKVLVLLCSSSDRTRDGSGTLNDTAIAALIFSLPHPPTR